MANKRVFYDIAPSGSSEHVIRDSWDSHIIPVDPRNSDYIEFLLLSSSDRALLIPEGSPIPSGTTNSEEVYVNISLPITGSN